MSVCRLLNIPIVFLLDSSNLIQVQKMVKLLIADSVREKIYVFSHYINPNIKIDFCTKFPSVIWKDVGETMIYEQLCYGGEILPTRVTFCLLPELLGESKVVILRKFINVPTLVKMASQIRREQSRSPLVETEEFSYLNLDLLRQTKLINQLDKDNKIHINSL